MIHFAQPYWLALLAAVPILVWYRRRRQAIPQVNMALFDFPHSVPWRVRCHTMVDYLAAAWLSAMVVALAQPARWVAVPGTSTSQAATVYLVDVSGSMGAVEAIGPQTRLDLVKAQLRATLENVPDAASALVKFSRTPEVVTPLTTDLRGLLEFVANLEVDVLENRTNIGDAIALAVSMLEKSAASARRIVLFTDGAHNVPEGLNPGAAARIAESLGVAIDCVAVGTPKSTQEAAGKRRDEMALRQIAIISRGTFRSLADPAVGKSASPSSTHSALATTGFASKDQTRSIIALALCVFALERVLRRTIFRILPNG